MNHVFEIDSSINKSLFSFAKNNVIIISNAPITLELIASYIGFPVTKERKIPNVAIPIPDNAVYITFLELPVINLECEICFGVY